MPEPVLADDEADRRATVGDACHVQHGLLHFAGTPDLHVPYAETGHDASTQGLQGRVTFLDGYRGCHWVVISGKMGFVAQDWDIIPLRPPRSLLAAGRC